MGPGREPEVCENEELVAEFELACRSGDYEFAEEYKKEIIKRLETEVGSEGNEVVVLSGKVKVIWLTDGKRNELVFDSREEAEPLMKELNDKGELWVLTDKFE